jgi:hypothetical protein
VHDAYCNSYMCVYVSVLLNGVFVVGGVANERKLCNHRDGGPNYMYM